MRNLLTYSAAAGFDVGGELGSTLFGLTSTAKLNLAPTRVMAIASASRLAAHGELLAANMTNTIMTGQQLGYSYSKTARLLRDETGKKLSDADMIVRTESQYAANTAIKAKYAQLDIDKVIWVSTLDKRVCPYCAKRSGEVYVAAEVSGQLHPRCRCKLSPYLDEPDINEWRMKHHKEAIAKTGDSREVPRGSPWYDGAKPVGGFANE
jgi:SPP1 gp7 family putative phage head morphogenesis protein